MSAKWYVKPHAVQRAAERFGIDAKTASAWFNDNMSAAAYVGNGVDDHGVERRLFTNKGVIFFADKAMDVVVSVRKAEARREFLASISGQAERQLRKKQRRVLEVERDLLGIKAETERELVDLRLAALRTRSVSRRLATEARISALELRLKDVSDTLFREKRELTILTEGFIAIS